MTDFELWKSDGIERGWVMPSAPWWKKLPVVRHVRAVYLSLVVRHWNKIAVRAGMIPSGYDEWVVYGIARGWRGDMMTSEEWNDKPTGSDDDLQSETIYVKKGDHT